MFLSNLFNFKKECQHKKISPNIQEGYCPDCGKLIKNEWYITRCSCCGIKLKTNICNNEIVPQDKYCINCGSNEYKIEKLDKISFININYAVLRKVIINEDRLANSIQFWEEKNNSQQKLLKQYL